jgi:hypothetical protein
LWARAVFDEAEILVGEIADRDFRDVDLLGAREFEQQMQRPFERVERNQKRIAPLRLLGRAEVEFQCFCVFAHYDQSRSYRPQTCAEFQRSA